MNAGRLSALVNRHLAHHRVGDDVEVAIQLKLEKNRQRNWAKNDVGIIQHTRDNL